MMTAREPLRLSGRAPLARGAGRLVFQHPDDETLLVKVVRPDGNIGASRAAWYKLAPREGKLIVFQREMHEFLVATANATSGPLPIPRIYGLIDTDLGPGLLMEKLTGEGGALAPTLRSKLQHAGLTVDHERLLAALIEEVNRHRIVLVEFKVSNIVFVRDSDGAERLMLVDGFGDSSLVPIYSLSRIANRWRNMGKYRKLIRRKKNADAR